jgi:GNAT superfamily N-acetyltransferase
MELIEVKTAEEFVEARRLFEQYASELGGGICFQGFARELESLANTYSRPDGCLILAYDGRVPIGCVAVRTAGDGVCEMKRLYVRESGRGRGLGATLARAAIRAGLDLGHTKMTLETLDEMVVARRIYAALGFEDAKPTAGARADGVRYMVKDL